MKKLSLLNHVYQNTQMGVESLPLLAAKSQDCTFRQAVGRQWKEYRELNRQAEELLRKKQIPVRDVGNAAKMSATVMTNMRTLMDRTTSHLAEMAIQGNTMGVTQITRALHEDRDSDPESRALAERLLQATDRNLQDLRKFL